MNDACKPEHILIRCKGCAQDTCTVLCSSNAVVYMRGDLLIEASKCAVCDKKGIPMPACIKDCPNSGEKLILEEISIEEKRISAADVSPLLQI